MRKLAVLLVVAALSACPNREPAAPAQSPQFVKHEVQQMKAAKADVEAAQKKEEVRDDKLVEEAK